MVAVMNDLAKVESDPLPRKLVNDIHYVASDESYHHLFEPYLKDRGGVFLGIGTNQNYTMIPWARPDIVILLDFDQMVVDVHKIYRVFFLKFETPKAFLEHWQANRTQTVEAMLKEEYGDDPAELKGVLRAFRYSRYRIHRALRRVGSVMQSAKTPSFLNDQGMYDVIVKLYAGNRVLLIRGDLTKKGAVEKIGTVLKKHKMKIGVYHPSNAESYFGFGRNYRNAMVNLPTDEKSAIVRTKVWAKYVKDPKYVPGKTAESDALGKNKGKRKVPAGMKKILYYNYATQSFSDFKAWLSDPKVVGILNLIPYSVRKKNGLYQVKTYQGPASR